MNLKQVDANYNGESIYLVGFRGSGKSTLGKIISQNFGWQFLDLDESIEAKAGKSIKDIFSSEGVTAFRKLETQALLATDNYQGRVIATGGGVVTEPLNINFLTNKTVIFLQVSLPLILDRLQDDQLRPPLSKLSWDEEITKLFQLRHQLYASVADITVRITDNEEKPIDTANRVWQALGKNES